MVAVRGFLLLLICALVDVAGAASTIQWTGRPDDQAAASSNTADLNAALATLKAGDKLLIPNRTFWLAGGVRAFGLVNATLRLDGTLRFLAGRKGWPVLACARHANRRCAQEAILISDAAGLTLTSTGAGTVDGSGESLWGYPNYLIHWEDRPKLLTIQNATDVLVESWHFRHSHSCGGGLYFCTEARVTLTLSDGRLLTQDGNTATSGWMFDVTFTDITFPTPTPTPPTPNPTASPRRIRGYWITVIGGLVKRRLLERPRKYARRLFTCEAHGNCHQWRPQEVFMNRRGGEGDVYAYRSSVVSPSHG